MLGDNPTARLAVIKAAAEKLTGAILRTPVLEAPKLSALSGAQVFLKYEAMQATGSFKERGARNALLLLDGAQKRRGVISASAGNHALGLAYHGSLLGIAVTVVMPEFAPLIVQVLAMLAPRSVSPAPAPTRDG